MKSILITIVSVIICFSIGCQKDRNRGTDMSETKKSDFINPSDIFHFAIHDLQIGMSRSEVEEKIGVGVIVDDDVVGFMYNMIDGTILEVVYGKEERVVAARIIADQRIKYELKY